MPSSLSESQQWQDSAPQGIPSLGIVETNSWTSAMVACDTMAKSAQVAVVQAEWNDMLGAVIKVVGMPSDVSTAVEAGGTRGGIDEAASLFRLASSPRP